MTTLRLVRSELRKLTTTKLLWGFLAAAAVLSAFVLLAVAVGAEAEGVDAFLDTAEDQRSLLSFATNALLLGGLFGALATAREYSHGTVVPMFLLAPRRVRAMAAKLLALVLTGALLGLVGGVLTIVAGAVALPTVDHELLLSGGDMVRLVSGSVVASLVGAVLGLGVGALVRNTGGSVTVIVLVLLLLPPIVAQLVGGAEPWVPTTLVSVVSGSGDDPSLVAALAALFAWAAVPAAAGVAAVLRRDVL